MMQLKADVKAKGLQPEILLAIIIAREEYVNANQAFTITSLLDGTHCAKSLHYVGQAVDIRTRDLDGVTAQDIARRIKIRLTDDYDVIVEGDHIHIEFDPK